MDKLVVIARNTEEMLTARTRLIEWADAQIARVRVELADYERSLEIAASNHWRTASLVTAVRTTRGALVYYEKLKAAFELGYVVVPNMPVDLFAVRVSRPSPPGNWQRMYRQWEPPLAVSSERLPVGEGFYVGAHPLEARRNLHTARPGDDPIVERQARGYQNVNFPLTLAKPQVLDAVGLALAQKLFDEIGVLPRASQQLVGGGPTTVDPMVVGTIVFKRTKHAIEKRVSFLITWWLGEEHLYV